MGGGKGEYDISLQFTEPKYGKVTVNHPPKSKPNVVVNISSNVVEEVEEDYGNTTYSIGAVSVATVKGQTIQVNSISNNNWSFIMPANDVIITASEIIMIQSSIRFISLKDWVTKHGTTPLQDRHYSIMMKYLMISRCLSE